MRLILSIVRNQLWPIYSCILVYSIGVATYAPVVPTLLTNYFATHRAGFSVACEDVPAAQQSSACKNAHSDVVLWSSVSSFFSNAVLSFFLSPLVGEMSDRYGRKPFMVVGLLFALMPVSVLLLYIYDFVPLFWYYPSSALNGSVSFLSVSLAAIADRLPPGDRAAAFGLLIACFAAGFMVGPLLGGFLPTHTALWICMSLTLTAAMILLFLQPETLPAIANKKQKGWQGQAQEADRDREALLGLELGHEEEGNQAARQATDRPRERFHPLIGFVKGCRLLASNPLFIRLAVCMAIVGIAAEGMQTVLIQYLQGKFQFKTADQGLVFEIWGFGGLLVQGFLLTWLVHWMGERNVLLLGLGVSAVENALLSVVRRKWQAFAAISLGCLSSVAFSVISALKSNNTSPEQQGLVQGALAGVRSLASGFGPLVYAGLFALFSRTSSPLCCHTAAPLLLSCFLMSVAFAVACTIHPKAGSPAPSVPHSAESAPDAIVLPELGGDHGAPVGEDALHGKGERHVHLGDAQEDLPLAIPRPL